MERYSVYEGFMEELRKAVKKVERKCAKYGCEFHYQEVGEEFKKVQVEGVEHTLRYVIVEAEGTAQINGWEFVASVEHTEAGNIYGKAMTDVEIPAQYKCSDPFCEHCKTNRIRKYTYIVRNTESNEFKQIGKACLKDYTNGLSAEAASFAASLKEVFEEVSERIPSGGRFGFKTYIDTEKYTRYCAETIKHFGYVKSGEENSTKYRAYRYYNAIERGGQINYKERERSLEEMNSVGFDADSDYAKETAKKAVEWITKQEDLSDYIHNLKVITSLEYTTESRIGFLASLIPAYNKATKAEEEKKAERQASNWAGEVGQKIKIDVKEVKVLTCWENDFSYYGGLTYLYKITDVNGNVFTWKTGKDIDENTKKMTGTIKDLTEYKGMKQTVLTRCKVTA